MVWGPFMFHVTQFTDFFFAFQETLCKFSHSTRVLFHSMFLVIEYLNSPVSFFIIWTPDLHNLWDAKRLNKKWEGKYNKELIFLAKREQNEKDTKWIQFSSCFNFLILFLCENLRVKKSFALNLFPQKMFFPFKYFFRFLFSGMNCKF